MNRLILNILLITCSSVILQSCTFTRYSIRNASEYEAPATSNSSSPCTFRYSISGRYQPRLIHIDSFLLEGELNQKALDKYIEATEKAFQEMGCKAEQAERNGASNFNIELVVSPLISALPQEWLTGLSLGILPSWGTRHGEYIFRFTNKNSNRNATYYLDRFAFNHLIVFPVFWLSFMGQDEIDFYKKTLIEFVGSEIPQHL